MVHKKGIQLSSIFIYTALSLLFIITFYPFWNIFGDQPAAEVHGKNKQKVDLTPPDQIAFCVR